MTQSMNIQNIWGELEKKLDRNWKLNLEIIRSTNLEKTRKKMTSFIWITSLTLAFYIFATYFFVHFTITSLGSPFIVASGIILASWTLLICIGAVHELELISRINYASPVTILQKQLSQIRLIVVKYLRLASWILPFSFVFIILFFKVLFGIDIAANAPLDWVLWNITISVALFLPLTIWINKKLNTRNIDKKWMYSVLKGNGSQIIDSIEFLKEIERFEKEELKTKHNA